MVPSACLLDLGQVLWLFKELLELGLLELVDVVTEFERRSQLQPQVFHDHVTFQQQQRIAIDLLLEKEK